MKEKLVCPKCKNVAKAMYVCDHAFYSCSKCNWNSDTNTLDILSKDKETAALSNFFPHSFIFEGVKCCSMESFIQSLREKDSTLQKEICLNYPGKAAYNLKAFLTDWKETGLIYWKGKQIVRISDEYTQLITRAYDALFRENIVFREVLYRSKDKILIHSIGSDNENETLLTELEFRYQLNRLRNML